MRKLTKLYTEPHEKNICQDSDSEDDCADDEPAQPKILSLSEAIGMMDDLLILLKEGFKMNSLSHSSTKVAV